MREEDPSPFTGGHSERVSQYVEILGQALKVEIFCKSP